jgi:hypothetical protein
MENDMDKLNAEIGSMKKTLIENRHFLFTGAITGVAEWDDNKKTTYLKQLAVEILSLPKFETTLGKFFDYSNDQQNTLWLAIKQACQFGFHIPRHCYLLPNWQNSSECQCHIRVTGMTKILVGPGKIFRAVRHSEVRENDSDSWVDEGTGEYCHKPKLTGDRGAMTGVIVQLVLANGEKVAKFIDKGKIDKRKNFALEGATEKQKKYSPWLNWPDEKAVNSALLQVMRPYMQAYATTDIIEAVYGTDERFDDTENDDSGYTNQDDREAMADIQDYKPEEKPAGKAMF